MTRLLLISGKGGVGKTTIAAATAVRAAEAGKRTLVVSVDRAHNLGDVVGVKLGAAPVPVPGCPGLFAMEADPQAELREHEAALHSYFSRLLAWAGVSASQADEVAVIPGLEELLVLSRLAALVDEGGYDTIVVDLAPTASSRLLSFPDLMAGPLGRFAKWERQFLKFARPAAQKLTSAPVPEDALYDTLELLAAGLARLRAVLADPQRTTVRLVCIPERVVVDETRSAFSLLSLFGLTVDGVILNRVLPDELTSTSLGAWVQIQAREIARAKESFAGVPVQPLAFQATEVLGLAELSRVGRALYGEGDPSARVLETRPVRFEPEALTIALPLHLAAGALDLQQQGDELIITLGGWRRRLSLPQSLQGRDVLRAKLAAGTLRVDFTPRKEPQP